MTLKQKKSDSIYGQLFICLMYLGYHGFWNQIVEYVLWFQYDALLRGNCINQLFNFTYFYYFNVINLFIITLLNFSRQITMEEKVNLSSLQTFEGAIPRNDFSWEYSPRGKEGLEE